MVRRTLGPGMSGRTYNRPMGALRAWHVLVLLCLIVVVAVTVGAVVLIVKLSQRNR